MKAIFFFIFSSLICQISWAQRTVPGLKDKQVQLELLKQTSKLDSLVFADKANYRYDDMILNGFGFKKKKVYSMKLLFEKVDVEPYTIRLVDVKKKKCKDKAQINMLKKLEIGKIRTISTDSLQIKAKLGDDVINLADGSSYTLLFIDQKRDTVYLKQCNSPVNYQKQYATKDRAFFITLFDALQKNKL